MKQICRRREQLVFGAFLFLAAICSNNSLAQDNRADQVSRLLSRLPAQSHQEAEKIYSAILSDHGNLPVVLEFLSTGDSTAQVQAKLAVGGLSAFVTKAGFESQRRRFSKNLADALENSPLPETKAFLLQQLQLSGTEEAVSALAGCISNSRLCAPAVDALAAIGGASAVKELLSALPETEGQNRIAIINALGFLKAPDAAGAISEFAAAQSANVRLAALEALAQIGAPQSRSVFPGDTAEFSTSQKSAAEAAFLTYIQNLAKNGNSATAAEMCRAVIKNSEQNAAQTRIAALDNLVDLEKERALPDLLTAVDAKNQTVSAAALLSSDRIPGGAATRALTSKIDAAQPELRVKLLEALGRRGDAAAASAVQNALNDEVLEVRLAAAAALAKLLGVKSAPVLANQFADSRNAQEIIGLKTSLASLPLSEKETNLIAQKLAKATPEAAVGMLELLSEKRARNAAKIIFKTAASKNAEVRIAALKTLENTASAGDFARLAKMFLQTENAQESAALQRAVVVINRENNHTLTPEVISAYQKASSEDQQKLLPLLGKLGGPAALEIVTAQMADSSEMKDAAVRALADWPDAEALPHLLTVAEKSEPLNHHVLAIRGMVRIIGQSDLTDYMKVRWLERALGSAVRVDEKKQILGALGSVKSSQALAVLSPFLGDEDLSFEAAASAFRIAMHQSPPQDGLSGRQIVQGLIAAQVSPEVIAQIEKQFAHNERHNVPPPGFTALFNGEDLSGWKGLVESPPKRAAMSAEELAQKQAIADSIMRAHWRVNDGVLEFDGTKFYNLCTEKDFGDFELLMDWKIGREGDSGVYLRGSPQVQIWDTGRIDAHVGSGGLYNNQKYPRLPLAVADKPVGEWNKFRILMINELVTVYLNDVLVAENVPLENYWERDKPIYPTGQIELQAHQTPLWFRNIFIREIPKKTEPVQAALFNGKDLNGWRQIGGKPNSWQAEKGVLFTNGGGGGWLSTEKEYENFKLELDFRVPEGGNSGVFLRAPHQGDPAYTGMEIQVLDDYAEKYAALKPWQYTGSIYAVQPAAKRVTKKAGQWQHYEITCDGPRVTVVLNGETIIDTNLVEHMHKTERNPGLKRRQGYIGLQNHGAKVEYRNIRITEF